MNLMQKISLANKVIKAIDVIRNAKNNAMISEIVDIIKDLIAILERIKSVLPEIGDTIDAVISIIRKWIKK